MDNYSFDTVQLVRDFFTNLNQEAKDFTDCKLVLQEQCPAASMPGVLEPVSFYASELSFDSLDNDDLRQCLENLPTSFSLPADTVTLLRQAARLLLMKSPEFRKAMQDLDSSWQPFEVAIDPELRARVCSP
jgi:hypothetical protein